jgi:hypothetical protein
MNQNYPDHLIPDHKKDKKWISDYIRAAYDESSTLHPEGFNGANDKYDQIKQYMLGRQPVDKYKKSHDPLGTKDSAKKELNLDYSILPIVPKFRRMALAMMNKLDHDLQADVVDPIAVKDKDKYYRSKEAKIMTRDMLKGNGMENKIPMIGINKEDPQDMDELKMHMVYGYKHQYGLEMELALDLVMNNHNNYTVMKKAIKKDLFDYGAAAVKEDIDSDGYIKLRKVNIQDLIVGYTEKENLDDISHIGEMRRMSIAQLEKDAKGEFLESELRLIADSATRDSRNNHVNSTDQSYRDVKIDVLDLEFYSVNHLSLERRKSKEGNNITGRTKSRTTPSKKHSSTPYSVTYKGKWIVNTESFYQCDKSKNMRRSKTNLGETKLTYHVIAPDLYQMRTHSMGEQLIAIADQVQMAWIKMQAAVHSSIPKGIAIDIRSLLNVPLGRAGIAIGPQEVLNVLYQRGILAYRGYDDEGKPLPSKPFEGGIGGLGDEADRWYNLILRHMETIRTIIGFNEITDGSTPDPRTANGVAEMSIASTNNSLDYIIQAEKDLTESLANNLTLGIHDILSSGKGIEGFTKPLGEETQRFFKIDKAASRYTYGVRILDRPTAEQRQTLARRIEKAIDKDQITMADAVAIENFSNVNQAEQVLAYRVRKNQEKQQNQQVEMIKKNGEEQMKAAQSAEEEKRKTAQMNHDFEMQRILAKFNGEAKLIQLKNEARGAESKEITMRDLQKKQMETDSNEYIKSNFS